METFYEDEIDLLELFKALLSKVHIIILCSLIGCLSLFAYSKLTMEPTYESHVYIYVNNSNINLNGTEFSVSSGDLTASKSLVDTYIVILKTRNTL
ncbi:MAG: Wzz/FepE/Etk N-terminal domain-containing protein [Erysipelotrichaceae bacterium]|nr:Wzz/FepE/Etk N-terminal domain-containing protein [Erysipelotrichaceae bacterium]